MIIELPSAQVQLNLPTRAELGKKILEDLNLKESEWAEELNNLHEKLDRVAQESMELANENIECTILS